MERYPFQSVFLDTCIVRYLATFPNMFFDGGPDAEEQARLARLSPTHSGDIEILRVLVNMWEREAPHDIVITPCVVRELPDRARTYGSQLLEWASEMGCIQSPGPHTFLDGYASFLDPDDRHLYLEANANGCDAFLTTDYRTIVQRRHLIPRSMTQVLTPSEWWAKMKPWYALFV